MGDHSPYGTVGHAIRRFPPPRTEERMMTSRHILIDLITIFKSLVAAKRLQEPGRLSQTAKGLSRACAQVQRSSSCACLSADLRSALDTIWRAHYLSETAESATPIGSCHAAPERCQIARGPSRADGSRFHRVNRLGPRSERALVDPEGCVTGSHDQHVRRLDADADDTRNQANHRMRTRLGRGSFQIAQPPLLDLFDLLLNHPQTSYIAAEFRPRVFEQRNALGSVQLLQTLFGLTQGRLEGADSETNEGRFDPIDNARAIAHQLLALPIRSSGILFLNGGDRHHAAVAPLAPQPSKERTLEQFGIEPVSLCPSLLAGNTDARGMNDIRLNAVLQKRACQPETVASRLVGHANPPYVATRSRGFVLPAPNESQQDVLVGTKFLHGLARDARQNAAYKPARQADLDNYNQRPVLFEDGKRAA